MIALFALSLAAAPVDFKVVSGEVGFEIDAPLDTITGVSRGVSGSATFDPAAWTVSPQAVVEVDLSSFRTGIDLRDEDLRDQFFETAKFAKATLTLTGLERASAAALAEGTAAEAVADGTLSLHGVDRPVQIPLRAVLDTSAAGRRLVVTGDFVVPLLAHHIERPHRLIFKLGSDVKVHVRAVLRAPPEIRDAAAPSPSPPVVDEPSAPPPPPVVAHRPAPHPKPAFRFPAGTAEGRGERAFASAKIGGDANVLSCRSCHSTRDERDGLAEHGVIKPASTMWNAASRASLWQGIATSPGHAADLCARIFMRSPGLDPSVRDDVEAYLKKLAPDPQPALDWDAIHLTRRSLLPNPTGGDARRGKKLVAVYCASCHAKGRVRPPLEPGLYEADMLVRRVRRIPGNDDQQMPLISITRLPDSDLRDIVTWLVGAPSEQIFHRAPRPPRR